MEVEGLEIPLASENLRDFDLNLKKIIKKKIAGKHFLFYHLKTRSLIWAFEDAGIVSLDAKVSRHLFDLLKTRKLNFMDEELSRLVKERFSAASNRFSIYPVNFGARNLLTLVTNRNLTTKEQSSLDFLARLLIYFRENSKSKLKEEMNKVILDFFLKNQENSFFHFLKVFKEEVRKKIPLNRATLFLRQNKETFLMKEDKSLLEKVKEGDFKNFKLPPKKPLEIEEYSFNSHGLAQKLPSKLSMPFYFNERDFFVLYLEKKPLAYFSDDEVDYLLTWQSFFEKYLASNLFFTPYKEFFSFPFLKKKSSSFWVKNFSGNELLYHLPLAGSQVQRLAFFSFPAQVKGYDFFQVAKAFTCLLHENAAFEPFVKQVNAQQKYELLPPGSLSCFCLIDFKDTENCIRVLKSEFFSIYQFSFREGKFLNSQKISPLELASKDNHSPIFESELEVLDFQDLLLFFRNPLDKEMLFKVQEILILLGHLDLEMIFREMEDQLKLKANLVGLHKIS